jgi:hypothetical protein
VDLTIAGIYLDFSQAHTGAEGKALTDSAVALQQTTQFYTPQDQRMFHCGVETNFS